MNPRTCQHCHEEMPASARPQAKYCSDSCRVMASRARKSGKVSRSAHRVAEASAVLNERLAPADSAPDDLPETTTFPTQESAQDQQVPEFPPALVSLPRWVRRTARKVPLAVDGSPASSTDPETWSDFSSAVSSRVGTGLGFVLAGDGIGCIDLDHVLDDEGTLSAEAEAILAELPETYIEVSMSGTGLHIFGTGVRVSSRKLRGKVQGEVIGSKKYVAMTGRRFRNAPLTLGRIGFVAGKLMNEGE